MGNQQFKPKPGDLIEIPRKRWYKHWALYMGDGDVVHLTSDGASGDTSTRFSRSEGIGVIKREPLADVAGNNSWKVNNRFDKIWKPLPVDKIIKKANEMIGCRVRYNVLSANCEHFVNSLRYGIDISFQFKPKPGDLIEIPRKGGYKHWALYMGDGDVVHLTSDGASRDTSTRFSRSEEIGVIKREPLADVAGNDSWEVNNGSDGMWKPLPVDKIIKKAKEMIGCRVRYNVLSANCEHFVNSLRYDKGVSFQVIAGIVIIGVTAIFSPVAAVAALGAACLFKVCSCVSSSVKSASVKSTSVKSTSVKSTSVKSASVKSTSVKSTKQT
ncbi:phospholipase A and acyltransferase 5-like [Leucoraja erinacea]|uniref:phospholipase A and acyltransferase 5-like n=1 Tax=Leucoraja erinaceus TaxID=7782 RepID=UPI002455D1C2|nr:phospholipase A and acyltransferase 5-like [Leucoraja erinacea]